MVMFDSLEDIFQRWRSFSEYSKALVTLATAIGTIVAIVLTFKLIYYLIRDFRLYVLSQFCCKASYVKKYGQWAVITGSTDGIGLCMAKELARRGHSIVVVSRNEEKLQATKLELEQEQNVGEVVTVKIDFSDFSVENYNRLQNEIDPENRDIGLLINNVGYFDSKFATYHNYSQMDLRNMVNINMLAPVLMTRMILPGMLKRQRGLVVNVSSMFGIIPSPYTALYGAAKTFVNSFSLVLQEEYASSPIDIINLTPGAVTTKLLLNASKVETSLLTPGPDVYARSAINTLSTTYRSYPGYIGHAIAEVGTVIAKNLGLIPFLLRLSFRMFGKNHNLSTKVKPEETGDGLRDI